MPPQSCNSDDMTAHPTRTTSRQIHVWESAYNAQKLKKNHWNFQIAKSVAIADGSVSYNVVWQSKSIAPHTRISWKDRYALNWTADVPAEGLSVTVSGEWQLCALGGAYDLDENGFWAKSPASVKRDSKFMTVGGVNYAYPGADGIHIVVGIQNADDGFDVIYVDPTSLAKGSSAKYQPQDKIHWWYQTDMRSSTMISTAFTAKGSVDLSKPGPTTNDYYYSTTYNYNTGTWITSEDQPNELLYAPPKVSFTAEFIPLQPLADCHTGVV